ncbi:peptide chain release factor N(5)-glutamine methyltransferase [bacterium]|nr:peptide chain release factor N(5)-glutamine methyltransferase [bacterium]MBU1614509.1 peptide chain release factor N(5)-glutamine methyltransferase [bacterium]
METTWKVLDVLDWTTNYFKDKKIASARLDAELLIGFALNLPRIDLYLNFDRPLDKEELKKIRELVKRRATFEPVAYLTGKKEFYSLEFEVTKDVLVPRPETEILVEQAIKIGQEIGGRLRIVDLGCGSGNIAISVAKNLEGSLVYATDVSRKALEVARRNAFSLGVSDRVVLLCQDLFSAFSKAKEANLILSNPPYISLEEYPALAPDIQDFEPKQALEAGEKGLRFYRKIIGEAPEHLKEKGYLILEIGSAQTAMVKELILASGEFLSCKIVKDYSGLDRVVVAQRK